VRERGEFQLTSALDRLRKEDGFLGLIIEGQRYDIGLPEYYLETVNAFSKAGNATVPAAFLSV
jgi:UTP--glucose-1-phosphate uridylyltransferase